MVEKTQSTFSKDDAIKALTSLGFTLGEAKTYTSLVGMGPIHATMLANLAEVPQPKIYGYLENLVQKTFVIRQTKKGAPDTFTAVPYEIVIETLEAEMQKKIKTASRYFEKVKDEERTREVEDLFSYFEGKRAVFAGLKYIIDNAQKNIIIVLINSQNEQVIAKLIDERRKIIPELEVQQLVSSNKLQKAPPIKKLLSTEGFQEILTKRPTIFYVDVDFENNSTKSMNMVLPAVDNFGQALINVKHPIALHFQIHLVESLLDTFQNIGMKIEKK